MFQPSVGTWQAVINYETEGEKWANVWHFRGVGGAALPAPTTANASWIRGIIGNNIVPMLVAATSLGTIELKSLDSQESSVAVSGNVNTYTGAIIMPPVPLNVALCITLRTAVGGRSGRGRTYLTGMSEGEVSARTFNTTYATNLLVMFNQMLDVFRLGGYELAVLSRQSNGVLRPAGLARVVTVGVLTDHRIDTQRRRLR